MRNKRPKGFTLIEVLGIIVVLGIVSVITVPMVYKVIESSQKNAFKETTEGIVRAADVYFARNSTKLYKTFEENGGLISFVFDEALGKKGVSAEGYEITYSGEAPIAGKVLLYNDGTIEVENLTNGKYYANKDADTPVVVTTTSTTLTREELTKAVKKLQDDVKDLYSKNTSLENKDKSQDAKITSLQTENTTLKSQVQTNTVDIGNLKTQVAKNTADISVISKNQLNETYPVGSIYISTSSTSPSILFGGVWEAYGTGRTLVGINSADGNFNTIGKTGGSTTTTLAAANLPSHSHSIPALSGSTSTAGNHAHTFSGTSSSAGAHTHTFSGTTSAAGNHTHNVYNYNPSAGGWSWNPSNRSGGIFGVYADFVGTTQPTHGARMGMDNAGNHTHAYSGTTSSAGAHTHTYSGTTSTTGNHSHTVSTNASTTGATGSGTAFSNLQPYVTVYMWRRTA
ncbi:MAG: prepilin-type N-terminal cleavage/methylation domain-containing protein [Bacilli bacterium]|nr:prepilin-type N-terminal cleavage/methylation domain-containing protein [Bacilli bacterium]